MKKAVRKLGLVLFVAALSFVPGLPQATFAGTNQMCPYEHFPCNEPFYTCCCMRGVICTSGSYECDRFCDGW